jgi:hypothetical protein
MNKQGLAWILFVAMKPFLVLIIALVWYAKMPTALLWLIPIAYLVVFGLALSWGANRVASTIVVLGVVAAILNYAPGPMHDWFARITVRQGG